MTPAALCNVLLQVTLAPRHSAISTLPASRVALRRHPPAFLGPPPRRVVLTIVRGQLAIVVTFVVSNFAIPVPVKVTQHIGEPVVVRSGESPEALAKRVQNALQNLIDRHQGRRHRSYWAALRDTWWPAVRAKRAGRGAGRGSLTQTG
jgi:hypothetical protein